MDEPKLEIPAWLPWATIAGLAALVACLGEFWFVERARNQLLKDESQLAESEVQGVDNQLEAERIVSRREIERLRPFPGAGHGQHVVLLEPSQGGPAAPGCASSGAVAWDSASGRGLIVTSGASAGHPDEDYQLWLVGPGRVHPLCCGVFASLPGSAGAAIRVDAGVADASGAWFVLVTAAKGQAPALPGLIPASSIVLATPPAGGRISPPTPP